MTEAVLSAAAYTLGDAEGVNDNKSESLRHGIEKWIAIINLLNSFSLYAKPGINKESCVLSCCEPQQHYVSLSGCW